MVLLGHPNGLIRLPRHPRRAARPRPAGDAPAAGRARRPPRPRPPCPGRGGGRPAARGRHATAEEVLDRVHGRVPGVSLPTVYAALELLADLGLASRVQAGRAVRYDPRADPHHHLVCTGCGAVLDLDAEVDLRPALERVRAAGAVATGVEVLVRGRCAACA